MEKVRRHLRKLIGAVVLSLLLLATATAYAAPASSLSVRLLDGDEDPVPGVHVELITVAVEGSSGYVLDSAFEGGPYDVSDLLVDSGADVAWDLYQYVWAAGITGEVKESNSAGSASFYGLPSGLYLVMERGGQAVAFSPHLVWLPYVTDTGVFYDVTSLPKTSDADTRTIHVKKLWDDSEDAAGARPASLEVTISRDGVPLQSVDLSAANLWQYAFRGLPDTGNYSISEEVVADYSLGGVFFDSDGNAVIVNEYAGTGEGENPTPTATIVVKKVWADDDDVEGKRPSFVTAQLIEGSAVVRTATLSESNGWTFAFTGLDAARSYTVKELAVSDYTATYSGGASTCIVVTNTYSPGTTDPGTPLPPEVPDPDLIDIPVKVVWVDDDDAAGKRPEEVEVHLISGGSIVDTAFIDAESGLVDGDEGWRHIYSGHHPFLDYSVWEDAVPDYTTTYSGNAIDGFVVTNTYTPESTDPGTPPDPSVPGEDPDMPDDPELPDTGGDPQPEIPQTGNQPLPAFALLALGLVLFSVGLVNLLRRRSAE